MSSNCTAPLNKATIVDIEFLYESKKKKFPKELCIYHLDSNQIQNVIISSPMSSITNPAAIVQNRYVTQHLHFIDHSAGFTSQETAIDLLKSACHGREVYVKGSEKARVLSNILAQTVFDLDKIGCPKVSDLYNISATGCIHPMHTGEFLHCSQVKCIKFGTWLYKHLYHMWNQTGESKNYFRQMHIQSAVIPRKTTTAATAFATHSGKHMSKTESLIKNE